MVLYKQTLRLTLHKLGFYRFLEPKDQDEEVTCGSISVVVERQILMDVQCTMAKSVVDRKTRAICCLCCVMHIQG